jgi:hypothetical protein
MRKAGLFVAGAVLCWSAAAFAAEQTLTGTISDSRCGATHKAMQEHNKDLTDRNCTDACVKGGAKYIFASGGKIYTFENQNDPALAMNSGQSVSVTGELRGNTIVASKISKSKS